MRHHGHIVPLPPLAAPASRPSKDRVSPDTINLDLLSRPEANSFHWAVLATPANAPRGVLFHAVQRPGWAYCADPLDAGFEARTVAVVQLDEFPPGLLQVDLLYKMFSEVPLLASQEEPIVEWGCRVWAKDAVRMLHASGFVTCPDVDALEKEALQLATENLENASIGGGYRVYVSSVALSEP